MKSKKTEIINANLNFKLKEQKDEKTKKQTLVEVKNDMLEELSVLSQVKKQQEIERKRSDERINAKQVLDVQINENMNKREQFKYEKEEAAKKMRKQCQIQTEQ